MRQVLFLLFLVFGSNAALMQAQVLDSISISPSVVFCGYPSTATVTLTRPAGQGGTVVTIYPVPGVTMPATVTVPAGSATSTFAIETGPWVVGQARRNASVQVQLGGVSKAATLSMEPIVFTIALTPGTAIGGTTLSGKVTMGTVTMGSGVPAGTMLGNRPAPGDVAITLSPYPADAGALIVPPVSVTIPSGQLSANFTVQTRVCDYQRYVGVEGRTSEWSHTGWVTLQPIRVTGVSVDPPRLTTGQTGTGKITLSAAAPQGGFPVEVLGWGATGTPWGSFSVPDHVIVPAGSNTATFNIATTLTSNFGAGPHTFTVKARQGGDGPTASFILAAGPPPTLRVVSFTVASTTLQAGESTIGKITLSGRVPDNPTTGKAVHLKGTGVRVLVHRFQDCCLELPSDVLVPSGSGSAEFTIKAPASVGVVSHPSIGVTLGSSEKSLSITTQPVMTSVNSLSFAEKYVTAGTGVDCTIVLNRAATQGGATISVTTSDSASLTVPATVSVPEGQNRVTIRVIASRSVTTAKTVLVMARGPYGASQSASVGIVLPIKKNPLRFPGR